MTYLQPDTTDQKCDWAYVTTGQTYEATTAHEVLKEEMLETWIYATSDLQHLLARRRELTKHGAIDDAIVRTYLGQLGHFAPQSGPQRAQLQQHLDDLNQIIERGTAQFQSTPPA